MSNVHEYVFKGNLDFFQKAEQAEKRLTAQEQAAAKISVENSKQVTASITAEQKIRVQENKAALQKELTDFKTAQREMQASVKQNTFLPSGTGLTGGLMGKSVILGSKEANAMKLKSEFDALSPSIKKASFDAEKFTTSLMGVGFAGVGVVAALEKGLDAYSKQEDALLQLKAATGDSTTEYLNLKNAAEQMQGKWGIADEEIESVQAFLLAQGRSEEQINKTINAGRLLAVVQGTDLRTAVDKLDATMEGNVGKMGKLEEELKHLTPEQLRNGDAVDIIAKKYKNLGDSLENSTGTKMKIAKQQMGEFWEGVGEAASTGVTVAVGALGNLGINASETGKILVTGLFNPVKLVTDGLKDLGSSALKSNLQGLYDTLKSLDKGFHDISDWAKQSPAGGFFVNLILDAEDYESQLMNILGLEDEIKKGHGGLLVEGDAGHGLTTKIARNADGTPLRSKSDNTKDKKSGSKKEEIDLLDLLLEKLKEEHLNLELTETLTRKNVQVLLDELRASENLSYIGKNDLEIKKHRNKYLQEERDLVREIESLSSFGKDARLMGNAFMVRPGEVFNANNANSGSAFLKSPFNNLSSVAGGMHEDIGKKLLGDAKLFDSSLKATLDAFGIGMDTELGKIVGTFGDIVNMIDSIINAGSSIGGLFGDIIGLFPGGGAVSALAGAAGAHGMAHNNYTPTPSRSGMYKPNIQVMVHSEIGKEASWRVKIDGEIYDGKVRA